MSSKYSYKPIWLGVLSGRSDFQVVLELWNNLRWLLVGNFVARPTLRVKRSCVDLLWVGVVWRRCGVAGIRSARLERGRRAHPAMWDCPQVVRTLLQRLRSSARSLERTHVMATTSRGRNLVQRTSSLAKRTRVIEVTSSTLEEAEEYRRGVPCPSGSNLWSLDLFHPQTTVVRFVFDKRMYVDSNRVQW